MPSSFDFFWQPPAIPYDLARAKQLLAEAGYPGGFELGLELTVKAYRLGMRVAEVPTTWRDRTAGESHFRLRKWLPHYLRWYVAAFRARAARGPA